MINSSAENEQSCENVKNGIMSSKRQIDGSFPKRQLSEKKKILLSIRYLSYFFFLFYSNVIISICLKHEQKKGSVLELFFYFLFYSNVVISICLKHE